MKNLNMLNFFKFDNILIKKLMNLKRNKLSYSLFLLLLLSFSTISCTLLQEHGSTNPCDLIGSWELYKQTGALQDVCPQERITFRFDSTAILQCPNKPSITRHYSAKNGVLSYTETGVSFDFYVFTTTSETRLELYGKNVSRNLFYYKINIINSNEPEIQGSGINNSSENIR